MTARAVGVVAGVAASWVVGGIFSTRTLALPPTLAAFVLVGGHFQNSDEWGLAQLGLQLLAAAAMALPIPWMGVNRFPVILGMALAAGGSPVVVPDMRFFWVGLALLVVSLAVETLIGSPHFVQFGAGSRPFAGGPNAIGRMVAGLAILVPLGILLAPIVPKSSPFQLPDNVPQFGEGSDFGATSRQHPGLTGRLNFGDQVSLGEDEVLRVKADRPLYLRGVTYSSWDGQFWKDFSEPDRVTFGSHVRLAEKDPNRTQVRQVVTAVRGGLDVAVGADNITSFASVHNRGRVRHDGAVELYRPLKAGESYTVFSDIAVISPADLRRADPLVRGFPGWMQEAYAQEDNIEPRVAQLARDITSGSESTYDKVRDMEEWFDTNVEYSRGFADYDSDRDLLDQFLFESRVGYCEQIATAMTVMLRSLGVPARLAVGYVPDHQDRRTGEWVSLEKSAHAWTEVYFPGVGWQSFDPTSGVPLAEPLDGENGSGAPAFDPATLAVAFVVIAAGALAYLALQALANRSTERRRLKPVKTYETLLTCGDLLERDWLPGMTIGERVADLRRIGVDPDACARAERHLLAVSYGPADAAGPGADEAPAEEAVNELKAACERRRAEIYAMAKNGPKSRRDLEGSGV